MNKRKSSKRKSRKQLTAQLPSAMRDVWARIGDDVGHMADKLASYSVTSEGKVTTGIFRDSMVENVRDLVERLPALNLTNDRKLNELYIKMRDRLCAYDAESLRLDGTLRQSSGARG
jgi:hypothetical protein